MGGAGLKEAFRATGAERLGNGLEGDEAFLCLPPPRDREERMWEKTGRNLLIKRTERRKGGWEGAGGARLRVGVQEVHSAPSREQEEWTPYPS